MMQSCSPFYCYNRITYFFIFFCTLGCLQMLVDFSDDLLPLVIPAKSGTTQAVRIVLANSKEDKDFLQVRKILSILFPG